MPRHTCFQHHEAANTDQCEMRVLKGSVYAQRRTDVPQYPRRTLPRDFSTVNRCNIPTCDITHVRYCPSRFMVAFYTSVHQLMRSICIITWKNRVKNRVGNVTADNDPLRQAILVTASALHLRRPHADANLSYKMLTTCSFTRFSVPVARELCTSRRSQRTGSRVARAKPSAASNFELNNAMKATATLVATLPSQAAIAMPSYDQDIIEMTQLAGVPTPLLYFGFLTTSLVFAAGTYIALSKIKLI